MSPDNKLSEQLADDAMKLTTNVVNVAKNIGKNILNGGEKKDDNKNQSAEKK